MHGQAYSYPCLVILLKVGHARLWFYSTDIKNVISIKILRHLPIIPAIGRTSIAGMCIRPTVARGTIKRVGETGHKWLRHGSIAINVMYKYDKYQGGHDYAYVNPHRIWPSYLKRGPRGKWKYGPFQLACWHWMKTYALSQESKPQTDDNCKWSKNFKLMYLRECRMLWP
jgi:hypothetical protein